ncbi:MAG: ABC transporter permease, partial [Clostridiales bacterium 43-6]
IPTLLLLMFLIYPSLRMIFMSFTNWDGLFPQYDFVGLKNYEEIFTTPEIWISLRNNCVYILFSFIQNVIALSLGLILVSKMKGRAFFKVMFFIPYIINSVAVAYSFNYVYNYTHSPINIGLIALGLQPVKFLSDILVVNFSLAGISMWRYFGYSMIIYIVALESVPGDLYEAAMVDGASKTQSFFYITLPSIRRTVELNLFLCVSGSLQVFVEPLVLTNGGPGYASSTYVTYLIKAAFSFNRYSFASAMSVALIAMVLIVTTIQRKIVLRNG